MDDQVKQDSEAENTSGEAGQDLLHSTYSASKDIQLTLAAIRERRASVWGQREAAGLSVVTQPTDQVVTDCWPSVRARVPMTSAQTNAKFIANAPTDIDTLLSIIDTLQREREWQPIETAPKNGRTLLLGYPNRLGKWRTVRGQWFTDDEISEWENGDDFEAGWYETSEKNDEPPNCWLISPTHWMPLPVNPITQDTASASGLATQLPDESSSLHQSEELKDKEPSLPSVVESGATPTVELGAERCVKCGHPDDMDMNGVCQTQIGSRNWETCRCRCQFPERIRSAAVRKAGVVYPCFAHTYTEITRLNLDAPEDVLRGADSEQGFVTSRGRFVDRFEALQIAQAAGQTRHLHAPVHGLFSEDLRDTQPTKSAEGGNNPNVGEAGSVQHEPNSESVSEVARRAAEKIFRIVKDKFDYAGTEKDCENTTASLAAIIAAELEKVEV